MTFYTYMMRNYLGKEGPASALAWDMMEDKETFPRNGVGKFKGWYELIYSYLVSCDADKECLEVFDGCWKEYEAYERKRLKRGIVSPSSSHKR